MQATHGICAATAGSDGRKTELVGRIVANEDRRSTAKRLASQKVSDRLAFVEARRLQFERKVSVLNLKAPPRLCCNQISQGVAQVRRDFGVQTIVDGDTESLVFDEDPLETTERNVERGSQRGRQLAGGRRNLYRLGRMKRIWAPSTPLARNLSGANKRSMSSIVRPLTIASAPLACARPARFRQARRARRTVSGLRQGREAYRQRRGKQPKFGGRPSAALRPRLCWSRAPCLRGGGQRCHARMGCFAARSKPPRAGPKSDHGRPRSFSEKGASIASHFNYQNARRRIKVPAKRGRSSVGALRRSAQGLASNGRQGGFLVVGLGRARSGAGVAASARPFGAGRPGPRFTLETARIQLIRD